MGTLAEDLARDRELIETHISWVFRGADVVLKVKKPVALGFLDFSTQEARRRACEQEVALNRRLTDGVYLDVVPITRDREGVHHVGGEGEVVDHAVRMTRLDDAVRADVRLRGGRLGRQDIHRLAERLAAFHAQAERSSHIDEFGGVATIGRNVRENFQQARALSTRFITAGQEQEIEDAQLGFLEARRPLFERRIRDGRIRDGHGDLRLEHVYLSDAALNIIDCIEFNDRFRYGDVCADLAFLAMDLVHHERLDLAEDLLARYARESSDYDLYALADFYQGYRAYVRAKVASFLASDEGASREARQAAEKSARSYYLHALTAQRAPLSRPALIAVGGLIASGKSHTAERLSRHLHCPVVDTDRTRKHLLGTGFEQNVSGGEAFAGAYSPEFSQKVYAEVLRRANVVLDSRRPVIIDATFRAAGERDTVRRLARRHDVAFRFVECRAPRRVAIERLRERASGPSVSDAREDLYDDFARRWEPVSGLAAKEWVRLDTTRRDADIEAQLRAML